MADPTTPLLGEAAAGSPGAAGSAPDVDAEAGGSGMKRKQKRTASFAEAPAPPRDASVSGSEASEESTHPLLRPFRGFARMHDDSFDATFVPLSLILIVIFIIYTYLLGKYEFEWGFTDSVYFMVQTITSIGYGDLVATNDRQRLEVTIYMLLGLSIAASALGIITEHVMGGYDEQLEKMDEEIDRLVAEDEDRSQRGLNRRRPMKKGAGGFIGKRKLIGHELKTRKLKFTVVSNIVQLILVVLLGAVAMLWFEPWNFMMTFYWATETITTVGYGNLVPTNTASKWFFILYALVGTFVFAKAVAHIAALPVTRHRMMAEKRVLEQFEMGLSAEMLNSFFERDKEVNVLSKESVANRTVNRAEFVLHALLLLDRVGPRDLADANDAFNQLDIDFNEVLDENDVSKFRRLRRYVTRNHDSIAGEHEGAIKFASTEHVLAQADEETDSSDGSDGRAEPPAGAGEPEPADATSA